MNTDQHCPACGEVMKPENSRPSTFPIRGQHPLVCDDDKACAERYSRARRPSYDYLTRRH